jgi:hypothetical protein
MIGNLCLRLSHFDTWLIEPKENPILSSYYSMNSHTYITFIIGGVFWCSLIFPWKKPYILPQLYHLPKSGGSTSGPKGPKRRCPKGPLGPLGPLGWSKAPSCRTPSAACAPTAARCCWDDSSGHPPENARGSPPAGPGGPGDLVSARWGFNRPVNLWLIFWLTLTY